VLEAGQEFELDLAPPLIPAIAFSSSCAIAVFSINNLPLNFNVFIIEKI